MWKNKEGLSSNSFVPLGTLFAETDGDSDSLPVSDKSQRSTWGALVSVAPEGGAFHQ